MDSLLHCLKTHAVCGCVLVLRCCPCSGSCLQVLTGHSEDVTCVVLTSRGRFAVTGSLDGTAQVWDMQAQDVSNTDVHDGKVRLCVIA